MTTDLTEVLPDILRDDEPWSPRIAKFDPDEGSWFASTGMTLAHLVLVLKALTPEQRREVFAHLFTAVPPPETWPNLGALHEQEKERADRAEELLRMVLGDYEDGELPFSEALAGHFVAYRRERGL